MAEFLYKYRCFDKNDAAIKKTENIIKNSSLYLSKISSFNDPFDSRLSFLESYSKQEIVSFCRRITDKFNASNEYFNDICKRYEDVELFMTEQQNTIDSMISEIGVLSLSANPESILMWSHYSNNHKGLVFQFEPIYKASCLYPPIKVEYKNEYNLLSYTSNEEDRIKELSDLLLIKYNDWKYEEEYRKIDLNFIGEKEFYKDELVGIIFGADAEKSDIEKMKQLCEENGFTHVKYKKAVMVPGKFELDIKIKYKRSIVTTFESQYSRNKLFH